MSRWPLLLSSLRPSTTPPRHSVRTQSVLHVFPSTSPSRQPPLPPQRQAVSLTMESLTLNDGTPYQRHYHYRDQKPRSPRLPTPDVSRSSRETLVGPYDNGPFFLRPSSGERSLGIPNGPTHYRRDSRNTVIPHSPPYLNGEGQKPSLPPLKTVRVLPGVWLETLC